MSEIKNIFTDGMSHINFVNGMIRMTFGTVQAIANEKGDINEEDSTFTDEYCLILPLNTFLNMFGSEKQLVDKLIEKEIITANKSESPIIPKK